MKHVWTLKGAAMITGNQTKSNENYDEFLCNRCVTFSIVWVSIKRG